MNRLTVLVGIAVALALLRFPIYWLYQELDRPARERRRENEPLIEAAAHGDIPGVKRWLTIYAPGRRGAELEEALVDAASAAFESSVSDEGLVVRYERDIAPVLLVICDQRTDPNDAVCCYIYTTAAGFGYQSVVRHCLAKGTPVDAPSLTGMTALMRAAMCRQPEIVEMLLAAGARDGAR